MERRNRGKGAKGVRCSIGRLWERYVRCDMHRQLLWVGNAIVRAMVNG